jgi:hypothetical protein
VEVKEYPPARGSVSWYYKGALHVMDVRETIEESPLRISPGLAVLRGAIFQGLVPKFDEIHFMAKKKGVLFIATIGQLLRGYRLRD